VVSGLDALEQLDHSPADVAATAARLRRTAAALSATAEAADRSRPGRWTGTAAEASEAAATELTGRLVEAFNVLDEAARLIDVHAQVVEETRADLRGIRLAYGETERRSRIWESADPALRPAVDRGYDERVRLERRWLEVWIGHEQAQYRLAEALDGLRDAVADRPWTARDHVGSFVDTLVIGPAEAGFALGPAVFVDRAAWAGAWRALGSGLVDTAGDPWGAARRALGIDALQAGDLGAAAATWVGGLTASARRQLLREWDGPVGTRQHTMDPNAPMPERQTLDEMADGVDLRRHDHALLGHTYTEHVADMSHDYMEHRLRTPRPGKDADLAEPPGRVSAFDDLDTANGAVTQALEARLETVRGFLRDAKPGSTVRIGPYDLGRSVGEIATLRADDTITYSRGTRIVVVFAKDTHGLFVKTAHLEP